jgi:hypothetical protein
MSRIRCPHRPRGARGHRGRRMNPRGPERPRPPRCGLRDGQGRRAGGAHPGALRLGRWHARRSEGLVDHGRVENVPRPRTVRCGAAGPGGTGRCPAADRCGSGRRRHPAPLLPVRPSGSPTVLRGGADAASCRLGEYQAQAAIAALHADAAGVEETDWAQIVEWYDELLRFADTPVVRLNRAVAVGEAGGAVAGLAALAEIGEDIPRRGAVAAYLHERNGDLERGAPLRRGSPPRGQRGRARAPGAPSGTTSDRGRSLRGAHWFTDRSHGPSSSPQSDRARRDRSPRRGSG